MTNGYRLSAIGDADPIATAALGSVKGVIGAFEGLVQIFLAGPEPGKADADGAGNGR